MNQEERIFAGFMFNPGAPELVAIKRRSHDLSREYSALSETETERRTEILSEILGKMGQGVYMQGPIFFHYGKHTEVGNRFFANYNLTVQDDAKVIIGDGIMFGPNVTFVTPVHPLVASERECMYDENGNINHLCYAKPVTIKDHVWGWCKCDDLRRCDHWKRMRDWRRQCSYARYSRQYLCSRRAL